MGGEGAYGWMEWMAGWVGETLRLPLPARTGWLPRSRCLLQAGLCMRRHAGRHTRAWQLAGRRRLRELLDGHRLVVHKRGQAVLRKGETSGGRK